MLRKLASKLHLYLGLAAFLILIPIGLTGAVLVFHDEIDALQIPELVRVEPEGTRVPVEDAARAASEAFPESEIERLELPSEAEEPYEVIFRSDRTAYVNPYDGQLLGSHLPHETVTGLLFEIHVTLLAGERGKQIVGLVGLLLLALGVTGVILWWRGTGKIRRGLTVKWKGSGRRVNYDLHGALGIYAVLPLMVVAFTGAGLVFYSTFEQAAHSLTGTPEPPEPPASTCCPDPEPPSLDALVESAQATFPEARPARIEFPVGPEGAYRVRLKHPEEVHPIGLTMVYLDRYSGEVLQSSSALEVPAAQGFGYWFYPLHIGSFGGLGVRLLYVLIGLAPVVLAVTGVLIWQLRRRKKPPKEPPSRGARPIPVSLPKDLQRHES